MIIKTKEFGPVTAHIYISPLSAVDSYITSAYTEERDLNDEELDYLNDNYSDVVQEYAWSSGETRNHN